MLLLKRSELDKFENAHLKKVRFFSPETSLKGADYEEYDVVALGIIPSKEDMELLKEDSSKKNVRRIAKRFAKEVSKGKTNRRGWFDIAAAVDGSSNLNVFVLDDTSEQYEAMKKIFEETFEKIGISIVKEKVVKKLKIFKNNKKSKIGISTLMNNYELGKKFRKFYENFRLDALAAKYLDLYARKNGKVNKKVRGNFVKHFFEVIEDSKNNKKLSKLFKKFFELSEDTKKKTLLKKRKIDSDELLLLFAHMCSGAVYEVFSKEYEASMEAYLKDFYDAETLKTLKGLVRELRSEDTPKKQSTVAARRAVQRVK